MTTLIPLKRVAHLRYGESLPVESRRDGNVPVFGSGGISGTHDVHNALGPAIVVGRKGSYGSIYWAPAECFAIDTAYTIDQRVSAVDMRWLFYVLSAVDLQGVSQDVGVPGLSREAAHSVLIPEPPPCEEQRRIANFLDVESGRIDRLVSVQAKAKSALVERRLALVWHVVTGGNHIDRRPSSLSWADLCPATWAETKINFVARMGSGHTPSRSNAEWWTDCTIPWITTGEVSQIRDDRREEILETREMISYTGMANSSAELHPAGTVVLSRTASAGFSAVMGRDMATSQDFATWTCGPRLDPYYLLWCLRAMRSDLLGRLAMGSTHKTIYVPDLQTLRIPLPPIDEQRDIVARIRVSNAQIDKLVDLIDQQQDLLVERRQALITAAVTGQVDPTTARSVRGT